VGKDWFVSPCGRIIIEVASKLPVLSVVPLIVTKSPCPRSSMVPLTVFSMVVLELTFTVTCPCLVVKVKVSPFMAAIVPFAPGRWAVVVVDVVVDPAVVVIVVVVVLDDVVTGEADEQAKVTTDRATDKTSPAQIRIIFLRFIFIHYSL
jgi:hypothetical protein